MYIKRNFFKIKSVVLHLLTFGGDGGAKWIVGQEPFRVL